MKTVRKLLPIFLALILVLAALPTGGAAAGTPSFTYNESDLRAAVAETETYLNTVIPSQSQISSITSTWQSQFSWDNEKRESANKSYLFEWSYYNGVVFEGLDYIYDATGNRDYYNKVSAYLGAMINGNTTAWKNCTSGNTSKQAAGYVNYHGVDCYKTASLLLDYGYTNMAAQLYADLQNAQNNSSWCPNPANYGYNFRHSWTSAPSYYVWLDGLYMVQPFMAEYADSVNDTAELNRIAGRFEWIGANMYNEAKGLYYHAANSATDHASGYWLRAVGWYAAAMADVIPYMRGEKKTAMIAQLKKLVDGMLPYQNATNGMWHNYIDQTADSGATRTETSGTALMAYAMMKAVNNGWLDGSYAAPAAAAFEGMCNYKLNNNSLSDICFKGSPGSTGTNSTFYNNEGKGLGPFIMAYSEMLRYLANPPTPTVTGITVNTANAQTAFHQGGTFSSAGIVVTAQYSDGTSADVTSEASVTAPNMNTPGTAGVTVTWGDHSASYSVTISAHSLENHAAQAPTCTEAGWNAYQTCSRCDYTTYAELPALNHDYRFSRFEWTGCTAKAVYVCANDPSHTEEHAAEVTSEDTRTETRYVLTSTLTAGHKYLIVSSNQTGARQALGRSGQTVVSDAVTVNAGDSATDGKLYIAPSAVDATSVWTAESGYRFSNGVYYFQNNNGSFRLVQTNPTNWSWNASNNRLSSAAGGKTYYLRFTNSSFSINTAQNSVYLYEETQISVSTAPTCTSQGTRTYTATYDGHTDTKTETLEALGHDYVDHAAQAPTCTEVGWAAYQTCSRCDYSTYAELPAVGHDYARSFYWAGEPDAPTCSVDFFCEVCEDSFTLTCEVTELEKHSATCTEAGSAKWRAFCSYGGKNYKTNVYSTVIPALGHGYEDHAAQAPTCTEVGWDAYRTCSRCDYSTYAELPATGHTHSDTAEENRTEPTCTAKGSYDSVEYCAACGAELGRETKELGALGHDYENHEGQAPTCTETGWEAYQTCTRCDYSTYAELPAAGHTPGEAVEENRVDPTCTEAGSCETVVSCAVCGVELSRETVELPPAGHHFVNHACAGCGLLDFGIDSHSCSFNNDLSINYYVPADAADCFDSAYMTFTYGKGASGEPVTVTVTDFTRATAGGTGYYRFAFNGIAAAEMGREITAVLHVTRNGAEYTAEDGYSVARYAYNMLAKTDKEDLRALCVALLNYGAAAQQYFGVDVDAPVNAGLEEAQRTAECPVLTSVAAARESDNANVKLTGRSCVLGNTVDLKFYVCGAEGTDYSNVTATIRYKTVQGNVKTVTVRGESFTRESGGEYSFRAAGIAAANFGQTVTVQLTENGVRTCEYTYSIETYCASIPEKSDRESLKALCEAMMVYAKAAKIYFAS